MLADFLDTLEKDLKKLLIGNKLEMEEGRKGEEGEGVEREI